MYNIYWSMYPGRVCVRERGLTVSQSLSPCARSESSERVRRGRGQRPHARCCRHRLVLVAAAAAAAPVHERARNDGGDEFQGGPDWAPADRTDGTEVRKDMRRRQPFFVVPS